MFKPFAVVAMAASIAAVATFAWMTIDRVDAGPLSQRDAAAIQKCSQRPWPYSDCAGTRFNTRVRLVTTDRLR
jgi:hypothetical protein